jgi:hypothetical protein
MSREGRAQRIETEAAQFEKWAADMERRLPPEVLTHEPVSDEEAKKLKPDDPAWQRHAVETLRRSAADLRAHAEAKRRGEW